MPVPSRRSFCENINHQRRNALVRHCPQCGEVVNAAVHKPPCVETSHAMARRRQTTFCVDCGQRLIAA